MKALTERRPKLIGIGALIVIVAAVVAILTLNRGVFSSGYQVNARFADAAGITRGTDVMVAGVKVGSVTGVTVHGNAVDAALSVSRAVQLPHDTDAAVQVETLLGVVDVTLEPESGWSDPLRNGALITKTSVPTELFQLQQAGQKLLSQSNTKALNSLVESLAGITKGKQSQVAQIIKGLGALTTTVDQRSGQVSQLIDSANTLSSTLAAKDQELVSIVNDLNTVSTGLADRSGDLSNLITNVDEMATQTNALVSGDSPALNALLSSLHTDLGVVSAHQEDLAEGVSYLGGALKGFASIADDGGQQVNWANIFVNPAGLTSTYGVIGPCGAFDEALTEALGPDPLPCDEQTGTTPGEGTGAGGGSAVSNSGKSAGSGSGSSSGAGGASTTTSTGASGSPVGSLPIAPNSGVGGLSQLLSPLLGGSGQ
jgi:phospholipid/cholesterol/gamma-HCH transport system substrate-binding protein